MEAVVELAVFLLRLNVELVQTISMTTGTTIHTTNVKIKLFSLKVKN